MNICEHCKHKFEHEISIFNDGTSRLINGGHCLKRRHHGFKTCFEKFISIHNQPERSKREDLDCCKRLQEITDMAHRYEIYAVRDVNYDIVRIHQYLIQEAKMRCSEHCGNTVRDK